MTGEPTRLDRHLASTRGRVAVLRKRAERTLLWQVWDRLLEIEFVDRSVALAGKAFVSFFPLVVVVAAFTSPGVRHSIFTSLTHRLGLGGPALTTAREAFASADDIRRATGLLGLVLTFFFATSFTTALQRVYLRAWRRLPGKAAAQYARGILWFLAVLALMAVLGSVRGMIGDGPQVVLFAVASLAAASTLWWFTAWLMLMGQVRWRVLLPSGVITGIAMGLYTLAADFWMSGVVTRNENQYGFFGVALALVSYFSGASICILVGACAGPVFAADSGTIGALVRGREPSLLVEGATPSLPGPDDAPRLRDAFRPTEDDQQ